MDLQSVSRATLKRCLKEWDFRKKAKYNLVALSVEVQKRIDDLWKITQIESQLLRTLKAEGILVSQKQLSMWRRTHNMKRRSATKEEAQEKLKECRKDVERILLSGQGLRYGRNLMQSHLKREGNRYSQHQIRNALAIVDPEGLENRQSRKKMFRVPFITDGPNHIWSVDGHDKLKHFGIEIYGAIDVYSRYIIWMYVGVSNRTAISVIKQFLTAVRTLNVLPKRIRSDKESETLQMGTCQYLLHRFGNSNPDVEFNQVYSYGTSKNNQRIESWWRQLLDRLTREWITTFEQFIEDGIFTAGDSDIIALLAVYMPILRKQIHDFVEDWNVHPIRKSNKPHVVPGQPYLLYLGTETDTSKPSCGIIPNPDFLSQLDLVVKDYDLDPYLTPEMDQFCTDYLCSHGYMLPLSYGSELLQAYKILREGLWSAERNGTILPIQLPTPIGNMSWIEEHMPDLNDESLKIDYTSDDEKLEG